MIKKFILTFSFLMAALVFADESFAIMLKDGTEKVSVSIIPNSNQLNPEQNIEFLVKFKMHDGWHILAENPGDVGIPTVVNWTLPEGYTLESKEWSKFKKFGDDIITQYGYDDVALYKVKILPIKTDMMSADFKADISWLACKEECVPEKVSFDFKLPITTQIITNSQDWIDNTQENIPNIFMIILMAFLGGLILNFMPCIFPILTIKAISVVQSRYNHRVMRIESLLYLAGVVLSFFVIATILVVLRTQGENIGWGFQLQSPIFVAIMLGIFIVIFLMLLDIVNLRNPFANKVGRISLTRKKLNAFVTGFFAVLIASPCTAPFMGIAIGYTISQPIYIYYPVFLALSLGYALPFTMVGFFPLVLYKILPKPGKWMITLKKIFAIPVFLTCVWLLWVLNNQTNAIMINETKGIHWENFDVDRVATLVEKGEPVFIDFTAKWCITCLANERLALNSDEFAMLVKNRNIHIFKADWTSDDDLITRSLEGYGRNSIPLYVYYDGKSDNYVILPQLLTPGIIKKYLK